MAARTTKFAIAALILAGCGGSSHTGPANSPTTSTRSTHAHSTSHPKPPPPPPSPYAHVLGGGVRSGSSTFVPLAKWQGHVIARIAHLSSGAVLMSFDQRYVQLHLHSGTQDAGAGFRYGSSVNGSELKHLLAAFNGGFRLSTGAGGFKASGRVAIPLRPGLGSVVTYTDGTTDVGAWHREVPAPGKAVASVRQNLTLLIDHGHAARTTGCLDCWGATLGGVVDPARAALGVTSGGDLVWAGGEHLTVGALAQALLHGHVVRAVELDINPAWVAGYVYAHHSPRSRPAALPVVAGQVAIPGAFLAPWSRDFFSLDVR